MTESEKESLREKTPKEGLQSSRPEQSIGEALTAHTQTPGGNVSKQAAPKRFEFIVTSFTSLRSILTSLAVIVFAIGLVVLGCLEFKAKEALIEPFEVPQALEKQGLNGRVIANKLMDQINMITETGTEPRMRAPKTRFIPSWPDKKVDMQVPGTGISFNSAISYIKKFFGYEQTRITGEVIMDRNKIHITIRAKDMPKYTTSDELRNLDAMLLQAGESVCKFTQPYILASYYLYEKKEEKAFLETIHHILSHRPQRDDPGAYTLWGMMLSDRGETEKAIALYKRATEIDAKYAPAYHNWGLELAKERDFEGAVQKYKKAIDLDPKNADAHNDWGNALAERNDFENAVEKYKTAIKLGPKLAYAYSNLGFVLARLGDFKGAVDRCQRAIDIDPKNVDAYNSWGVALARQKDFEGAIAKYKETIDLDPRYVHAYNNWGLVLADKKDFDKAIEKYKKAIDIDPNYALAYNNWGNALADKKDFDKAIEKYKKAIDVDPRYADAYNSWGVALENLKKFDGAIEKYKKAIELDARGEFGRYARERLEELNRR